jgi:cupin fold WbuC family metalloprotein
VRVIDAKLLANVTLGARQSPRGRRNHNFHRHEEPVQRLLNALEPGSYVRPHLHEGEGAFEMFVVLRGEVGCMLFDSSGGVTSACRLAAGGDSLGIEIPGGVYHSLVSLSPGTVVLEIKQGPYDPTTAKQWLAGYPDELDVLRGRGDDADSSAREAALKAEGHVAYWEGLCRSA